MKINRSVRFGIGIMLSRSLPRLVVEEKKRAHRRVLPTERSPSVSSSISPASVSAIRTGRSPASTSR